jgi:hypothetical protein
MFVINTAQEPDRPSLRYVACSLTSTLTGRDQLRLVLYVCSVGTIRTQSDQGFVDKYLEICLQDEVREVGPKYYRYILVAHYLTYVLLVSTRLGTVPLERTRSTPSTPVVSKYQYCFNAMGKCTE